MNDFLEQGKHESLKGGYHALLFCLAAGAAGYNLACLVRRPKFYLFVNAALYSAIAGYEVMTVRQHWSE